MIETSSKGTLNAFGSVDAGANNGQSGNWLLDPVNLQITASHSDAGLTGGSSPFDTTGGSNPSYLSMTTLKGALTGGANVIIRTTGGAGAGNITLASELDYNGKGSNSLTLQAAGDININAKVWDSVAGGGDSLNLTLTAGSAGNVVITAPIQTNGGNFTSSGYGFNNTGGPVTTQGGQINLNFTDVVTIGGLLDTAGGSSPGNVSVTGSFVYFNAAPLSIDVGAGNVTLKPAASVTSIGVGNASGDFTVTGDDVDRINCTGNGTITIGDRALAVDILADGFDVGTKNIHLTTGGNINNMDPFGVTNSVITSGQLTLDAAGIIGDTGSFRINATKLAIITETAFDIIDSVVLTDLSVTTDGTVALQSLVDLNNTTGYDVAESASTHLTRINGVLSDSVDGLNFTYRNTAGGITVKAVGGGLGSTIDVGPGSVTLVGNGVVTVENGASIRTDSKPLSITGTDFVLGVTGSIDTGSGDVLLMPAAGGGSIGVGNAAGSFTVSGSEINQIASTGTISIGNRDLANNIVVDGLTVTGNKSIRLATAGTINDVGPGIAVSLQPSNLLTLDAGGAIGTHPTNPFNVNVTQLEIVPGNGFDVVNAGILTSLSFKSDGNGGNKYLSSTGVVCDISESGGNADINKLVTSGLDFTYENTGGNICVGKTNPVDVGAGVLRLVANGAVSQVNSITAGSLGVRANGDVTLNQANHVGTLAVANSQAGAKVEFKSVDPLVIGTVTAAGTFSQVDGITTTPDATAPYHNDVLLDCGGLTLNQPVNAPDGVVRILSSGPVNAASVNAGITASALGVRSGGDVTLSLAANDVGILAVDASGTAGSKTDFQNYHALTIGSVTAKDAFLAASGITTADSASPYTNTVTVQTVDGAGGEQCRQCRTCGRAACGWRIV